MSSLKKIVDAPTVRALLQKGIINRDGVRLFDCTYFPTPRPDWKEFRASSYAKFAQLMQSPSRHSQLYASAHIPSAVHCDLDVAMYPSKYQRFTMYPAEIFQEYIQLLGVQKDEHIVVYSRGAQGGMLMAGKVAWLLKSYGQDKLSLLDGGLENWHQNGFELSNSTVSVEKGDWTAVNRVSEYIISFEELEAKDGTGKQFIEKIEETNFIDTRIRGQFQGTEDTGLDQYAGSGSHIPGFINVPSAELVGENGLLKSEGEIQKMLPSNGLPSVTSCNMGIQAAFLAYVASSVDPAARFRLYPGGVKEMELRDSKKISAGRQHFPH